MSNLTDVILNTTVVDESSPTVWPYKLMAILCTLGLSLLLNAVVVCCPFINNSPRVTSVANAFSAGIFIVLSVTHLLGEAIDGVAEGHSHDVAEKYRPALSMACLGYFFMIWLQRCIFKYEVGSPVQTQTLVSHNMAVGGEEWADERKIAKFLDENADPDGVIPAKNENPLSTNSSPLSAVTAPLGVEEKKPVKGHPCSSEHIPILVILAVFYIHSFTEGFVVGLEDTRRGVLIVFLAIFLHQWAEDVTFSLMTGQSKNLSRKWRYALTIVEASACPTGIAMGWAVRSAISDLTAAYLTAFSAGTFMMMAMTQTIPAEMKPGEQRWVHGIAMVAGGALIWTVMMLLFELD